MTASDGSGWRAHREGDTPVTLDLTVHRTNSMDYEAENLFQSNCSLGLPSFIVQAGVSHPKCLGSSHFLHWHNTG